uniref:Mitochondrial transcription termination factor family protein n=1 Tax=Quercus lobata TaxID=97700 RepID=A0A7N2LUR8_QUELO
MEFMNQAVLAIRGMNKSTWERKVNAYKRWGLSEDEILVAFAKNPCCFRASEDKIMMVMDFLINKMGLEASLIVKRPTLISLSLEKRLIPRALAIQFLRSKGLVKKNFYLPTAFEYVEELFLQSSAIYITSMLNESCCGVLNMMWNLLNDPTFCLAK